MKIKHIGKLSLLCVLLAAPTISDGLAQPSLRSSAAWSQTVDAAGKVGTEVRTSFARFDRDGLFLEQVTFNQDGSVSQRVTNTYNSTGCIIETSIDRTDGKSQVARTTYIPDKENRVGEATSYAPDGSIFVQFTYAYNENNDLLEVITSTPDRSVYSKVVSTYDGNGRLRDTRGYHSVEEVLIVRTAYDYDNQGNQREQIQYDGEGNVIARSTFSYNRNGKLIKTISYDQAGRLISETSYVYNAAGNNIEMVIANQIADLRTKVVYAYDENGRKIGETKYNKLDIPIDVIRYEYEYYGN